MLPLHWHFALCLETQCSINFYIVYLLLETDAHIVPCNRPRHFALLSKVLLILLSAHVAWVFTLYPSLWTFLFPTRRISKIGPIRAALIIERV